jgi:hypothetical protein
MQSAMMWEVLKTMTKGVALSMAMLRELWIIPPIKRVEI